MRTQIFVAIAAMLLAHGVAQAQSNFAPPASQPSADLQQTQPDVTTALSLNDGLLAYYPFAGNANDASGHGLNAIVAGAALAPDRFGQTNAAYAFNGRGAHLQINDASRLLNFDARSNTYSVALWVKLDSLSRRQDIIIDRASLANPPSSYDMSFKPGIGFVANCWDGAVNIDVSGTTQPVTGQWYQVAMVVNAGDIRLFVNGLRENGPLTGPGTPNTMPLNYGSTLNKETARTVGEFVGQFYGNYLAGALDEIRIYGRALSDAEVAELYAREATPTNHCVPAPAGLVSWWPGEGIPLDAVGLNDGIPSGNLAYGPGEVGQAFSFDGTTASITAPASPSLNVRSFTFDAWINPAQATDQMPIVEYGSGTNWSGVHFWISVPMGGGPGTLFANIRAVGSGLDQNILSSAPGLVQSNQWSYVALTFDQAAGLAQLYLNGTSVAARSLGSIIPMTDSPLNIGLRPVGVESGGGLRFRGRIDELSLFSRALTPAEIQAIYAAGKAGKCAPPPSPPIIFSQPADQTIVQGGTATFTVAARGTPPLSYQWYFKGSPLPGQTDTVLLLTDVQADQAGVYRVTASNSCGFAVSSNATLTVDRPPVADASATSPRVIVCCATQAAVVLDGSRSSDPDGDPLQYLWYEGGRTSPVATGAVAIVTAPLGIHIYTLVVSDGIAGSTSAVVVEVLSSAQAISQLIEQIRQSGVVRAQPLIAILKAASASIGRCKATAAVNQLHAFQNMVRAQVAPENGALAAQFTGLAQEIIDSLDDCGGQHRRGPGKIHARWHHGRVQLQFAGWRGHHYVIESSRDLVHWKAIGVATGGAHGMCRFEDADTDPAPKRYYRVVAP